MVGLQKAAPTPPQLRKKSGSKPCTFFCKDATLGGRGKRKGGRGPFHLSLGGGTEKGGKRVMDGWIDRLAGGTVTIWK